MEISNDESKDLHEVFEHRHTSPSDSQWTPILFACSTGA